MDSSPAQQFVAVVLAAGLLTACASPAAHSAPPEASASPTPAESQPTACADLRLLGPNGAPVQLAGTWTAREDTKVYYVSQSGSCVWLAGGFETSRTSERRRYGGLGEYTIVFSGTLGDDFTVSGSWSAVRDCGCPNLPYGAGTIQMRIDFDADGDVRALERIRFTGREHDALDRLIKISDDDIPPP